MTKKKPIPCILFYYYYYGSPNKKWFVTNLNPPTKLSELPFTNNTAYLLYTQEKRFQFVSLKWSVFMRDKTYISRINFIIMPLGENRYLKSAKSHDRWKVAGRLSKSRKKL